MAIRLNAADTHVVLTALWDYREDLQDILEMSSGPQIQHIEAKIKQADSIIKSYKRSFAALDRLRI